MDEDSPLLWLPSGGVVQSVNPESSRALGMPQSSRCLAKDRGHMNPNYLTASFRALPARNFTTLDALILMVAPV